MCMGWALSGQLSYVQVQVIFQMKEGVFAFCEGWRSTCPDSWTCYFCFPTVSFYADTRILSTQPQRWPWGDLERPPFQKDGSIYFTSESILVFPGVGIACIASYISIQLYVMALCYKMSTGELTWQLISVRPPTVISEEKMITFNPFNHLGMSRSWCWH